MDFIGAPKVRRGRKALVLGIGWDIVVNKIGE
jgi:hypothetical protein